MKDILESECCYETMTHSILTNDSDLLETERVGEGMYIVYTIKSLHEYNDLIRYCEVRLMLYTFIEERKRGGLKNV